MRFCSAAYVSVLLLLVACGNDHGGGGSAGEAASAGASGAEGGAGGATGGSGGAPAGGGGGDAEAGAPPDVFGDHGRRLALGNEYGCALDSKNRIICWGTPTTDKGQTTPPTGSFSHVRGYGLSNCAFDDAANFQCWGEAYSYTKGDKSVDIGIGLRHRCLLKSDASITCTGDAGAPETIPPKGTFLAVAAASGMSCAIKDDQTLVCFGSDVFKGLAVPKGTFSRVAVGDAHQCAISTDNTVACWGAGTEGDPNGTDPMGIYWGQSIAPSGSFRDVCAGFRHSCAIRTDGTLACWGLGTKVGDCDNAGECGQAAPPSGRFVEVECGLSHSCGIREDGVVVCWGSNNAGRATPPADLRIF